MMAAKTSTQYAADVRPQERHQDGRRSLACAWREGRLVSHLLWPARPARAARSL